MDLIVIVISSLVLVPLAIFTSGPLRIVLGLAFVLFFPGYALIAALFPKKESLGGIERVALSFGLSIAVVPLIGLMLNYTPWGIRLYPMLISILSFIMVMLGVAYFRRKSLVPEERFTVSFNFRLPSWQGQGRVDKVLSVVLVVAIIGAIGTLIYVISVPKVGERFSEFYILGPQWKAEEYPTSLKLGERGEIILGIVNHEQEEMDYLVKVVMNGAEDRVKTWVEDENGGITAMTNNTVNIQALVHDGKWERVLLFEPLQKGKGQEVKFLLLKDTGDELSLHLWVDVS